LNWERGFGRPLRGQLEFEASQKELQVVFGLRVAVRTMPRLPLKLNVEQLFHCL